MDNDKLKDIINSIADEQGFRPAIIEKDYHLTMILNAVNEHLSRDIIFKGGTLLNKVLAFFNKLFGKKIACLPACRQASRLGHSLKSVERPIL